MKKFNNPSVLITFTSWINIIPHWEYIRWSNYMNLNIDILFIKIIIRVSGLKKLEHPENEYPF